MAGLSLAGDSEAGAAFEFASAAGTVFELASAGGAVFELASAGGAEFELASVVTTGASTGASEPLDKTETLPVNAGMARSNADSMKVVAAPIVTLESTVAVPRGLKAVLETLLVNNAPASVFPGWSKTAATSTRHERKNNPYKK